MERVFAHHAGRVPFIPNLGSTELEVLHHIFDSNRYADEPSMQENGEADILKMLFARGLSVGFDQARRTFHPLDLDKLIESGLLYEENHEIKAHFQAQPYSGLIFFSDFFKWESDRDFVLSIGPAGNYLALLTIRRQVNSTLDLGCGCGIQSLLAARHSNKVIATDINPRALALTQLNAKFNSIHNIETRQGSYFEPVKDQRFDLIVANLPYVIAPETNLTYRNVDQPGDISTHERLREIPAYLNEGGFAQILINWIHKKVQVSSEPLRQTMENKGVDTWLIHNASKQPAEYAEMWLKYRDRNNSKQYKKTMEHWLRWYDDRHIEQIALGAIIIRRRDTGQSWFHSADVNGILKNTAYEQFARLFAAQDYLSKFEDANALLNLKFKCVDLMIETLGDRLIAYSTSALRLETEINPASAAVLRHLDGRTVLGDVIESVCNDLDCTTNQFRDGVVVDIKTLFSLGLLALES